ncbi:hypothetical protein [Lactococcus termiticola]|uniref:Uncharacterized protein n=1 Tax=Lactococcus termiticola TaxID=2169526 RepID=A0A2R5HHI7_9LACT|nr:hypothetical protein [Lactococcus termiticola]GBG97523.1 hypothetical protein NtB2_01669 [Lactococcus termiticola]
MHPILIELFSERGEEFFVPPILKLRKIELTFFIISKYKRLRDDAKEMDSNNLNLFDSSSNKNIENGTLLFVENHLCLNDSKYISYMSKPFLTPYARHHNG